MKSFKHNEEGSFWEYEEQDKQQFLPEIKGKTIVKKQGQGNWDADYWMPPLSPRQPKTQRVFSPP